nr:AMP-binding protein [Sphingomonas melonis]
MRRPRTRRVNGRSVSTQLHPAAIARIVQAVVRAEIVRLRGGREDALPSGSWATDMPLGDGGLGLDSLAFFGILAALAEMFDLDAATLTEQPPEQISDLLAWVARAPGGAWGAITVATSGSTGRPKRCTHVLADLLDEAAYFASMVAGRRRVVAMVCADHLYGLIWTALLPAVAALPVVERRIGARLDLLPGDLVVAVPDQWRVLPRLAGSLPADVWGVSSGAPLPGDVEAAVLNVGIERLLDVYGASELSAVAVRVAPDPDYRLLPRWRLAVGDDAVIDRHGEHWPLPDRVTRTGERALRPVGRRDAAVQVGGHNVWPQRVAEMLRAVPGVADASVRLGADARLKAFVVPDDGIDARALERSLQERAALMSAPERPVRYAYGAALPRTPMGKLADWS